MTQGLATLEVSDADRDPAKTPGWSAAT